MAEDSSPLEQALAGLSDDDIMPNVYEGGFKTWECSIDLANYLVNSQLVNERKLPRSGLHIIEVCASGFLILFQTLRMLTRQVAWGRIGSTQPSTIQSTLIITTRRKFSKEQSNP